MSLKASIPAGQNGLGGSICLAFDDALTTTTSSNIIQATNEIKVAAEAERASMFDGAD